MSSLQCPRPFLPLIFFLLLALTATSPASGELRLEEPLRPPRVYASAPSRVDVTAVRVVDDAAPSHAPAPAARYYLHESNLTDHRYFHIDEHHGNITTDRYLDRSKGEEYRLIVMALVSGKAINEELTITVTQYNKHDPTFNLSSYSAEMVTTAEVGESVITVEATDQDPLDYNRDLLYFLARPSPTFTLDPFLDPPRGLPVVVDGRTGEVRVTRPLQLSTSPLRLVVGVVDGGSPQRYALTNLTIYIRDMPAPQDVSVSNTSESSLTVCWSPPGRGHPLGYLLSYTPAPGQRSLGKGSLNLTTEQLHTNMFPRKPKTGVVVGGTDKQAVRDLEVYRYCAIVGGLARWTEYMVGVRAWRVGQVSMAAVPTMATTRSDYCAVGVCGESNCTLQQPSPGYTCSCLSGWYGQNCQHHNPCIPDSPCMHFGKCMNDSDGSYVCECPRGFYGHNCSQVDPCAAVSSNPCSNGGSCISQESREYTCICPEGYFGGTCEHENPCHPNPCHQGALCTNLTDTEYFCDCPPGYTGKLCESEADECEPNPCLRGHCRDHLNDFTCVCPKGWGGKTCDLDVESCPAQTTHHSTGEFLWPATRHGESVTLSCPYGIRATTGEISISSRSSVHLESLADATKSPNSEVPFGIQMMAENKNLPMQHPTELHHTTGVRRDEWEGGNLSSKRRTRDVDMLHSGRTFIPITQEESAQAARRRFISESIRGTSRRLAERRYQHRKQRERLLHERSGDIRGLQPRKGSQIPELESVFEGQSQERAISSTISRTHLQPSGRKQPLELLTDNEGLYHTEQSSAALPQAPVEIRNPIKNVQGQFKTGQHQSEQVQREEEHAENSWRQAQYAHSNHEHSKAPENSPAKLAARYNHHERRGEEADIRENHGRLYANNPYNDAGEHIEGTGALRTQNKPVHRLISPTVEEEEVHMNDDPDMTLLPRPVVEARAVRSCLVLDNGTVAWKEPSTGMCREKAAQTAEKDAKDVATLTATPAAVDPQLFTQAAKKLSQIVLHALHDSAVANNMVSALSNMMAVNDSVVAAGDEESDVTGQIVETINTFTENVVVDVGQSVQLRSENLIIEARVVDSSVTDNITFLPQRERLQEDSTQNRKKRNTNSTVKESFLSLPSQILKLAGTQNVRLEFVSYANDKFFRGQRVSGLPVIAARVTNTVITNLSQPVVYYIPVDDSQLNIGFQPICVFWDEKAHDWSEVGMTTLEEGGVMTCQATHLTAFSILLDPLPSKLGAHATTLSVITYVGLSLSTAGLLATVATYALFRSLNRDRSGKVVMNLSLALLLLNFAFLVGVQLQPPSLACTTFAAVLHYLVLAAFAWMLVEAANMYQLLITVFASSETHFMAKRVVAAWGLPVVPVVCALVWDTGVYGDAVHGYCVISPKPNPAVYYTTYLGPICLVLLVNCVVFVMVTRVLCQRRPRSHKPKSPSCSPTKELPITLAQIRGAVTVVALLGVTWVAGALSVGGARLTLQYIFCLATPLQGLIIFIVRVAQHPEARASWLTLLTEGTLRRRPPTTHTHSTQSSAHTHSTSSSALTPLKSMTHTTSTRVSPRGSIKSSLSSQRNGSARRSSSTRNGNVRKRSRQEGPTSKNSSMGKLFSRLVSRMNSDGLQEGKATQMENDQSPPVSTSKPAHNAVPLTLPTNNYSDAPYQESYLKELVPQNPYYHNNKNGSLGRPQSLVLLRTDSHGGVSTTRPSIITHDYAGSHLPPLLPHNLVPQELLEAGIPSSMIPRRSLGSLMLFSQGKEGDDSSWHFVRPPPDGRSDPACESETAPSAAQCTPSNTKVGDGGSMKLVTQTVNIEEGRSSKGACIVLAGQRVATTNQPVAFTGQQKGALTRATSELYMNSPQINPADLRRSASVYTLGEWEDPRASLV